jgi:ribosomal protein L7/L12
MNPTTLNLHFILSLVKMMMNFPEEAKQMESVLRNAVGINPIPISVDFKVTEAEMELALTENKKICAIRCYRNRTQLGLLEAKTVIEKVIDLRHREFDAKAVADKAVAHRSNY